MRWPVLLFLAAAFACGRSGPDQTLAVQRKPGDGDRLLEAPDFTFEERSGGEISKRGLKGKVWIVSFIFTRCSGICIPMCGEMAKLQQEFAGQPDFRIVAVTVDPERDTLEVLDRYGEKYGADPARWFFARSDIEATRKLAYEGLKLPWNPENPILHSSYLVLVDRDGWIRGYFNQDDPDRMKTLRGILRQVLAEKAP